MPHSNPRLLLARNLKAMMEARGFGQMELHRRSGVAQSTVGRILRSETAADVETVCAIARALDVPAWNLLVPGLTPENLPVLQPLSADERDLYERLKALARDIPANHRR